MNYPFLLETRHIPGVIQISGENKGVNSHIVEVKLMWGQAPLVGVSCFVLLGLLLPDISTGAAMQPVGLWGPFMGLAVVGVAGGRWEMQDETSRSFGDHENSLSFRKAENCGVWIHAVLVERTEKGLNTEIAKEIPHEKHLPLLSMLDKKSSLFKS